MMFVFTMAVEFSTHDELKNGINDGVQFAAVMAATENEATLIALQMVGSRGVMVTGCTVLEVMEV